MTELLAVRRALKRLPRDKKEMVAMTIFTMRKLKDDPLASYRNKYYWRPVDWIDNFVEIKLPRYMRRAFGDIQDGHRKVALQGPHGIGKTVFGSLLILWAGSVSDDCKIPTTASAWRQLTKYLWPEVHKWYGRTNWQKIGFAPELLSLECHFLKDSTAFALACTDAATIEGAHAKRVVYLYDEAKAIPTSTWDASEGAFSTPGDHIQVALSTPGDASGVFYNICSHKAGYESWKVHYVSPREAIRHGRMTLEWAKECRKKWGKNNPAYLNRVWGRFAEGSADSIIPLAWVNAAIERWHKWNDEGCKRAGRKVIGADVSRGGSDRCAVAHRYGKVCEKIEYLEKTHTKDTMITAGHILLAMGADGISRVDVIGVGAGVVDRIREQVYDRCLPLNAAGGTKVTDRSGELRFANIRAAMWWAMREWLDPENGEDICLPDDPEMIGDLTTPKLKVTSQGKMLVESKEEIKKRIGRSTDAGDAVCHAFFDGLTIDEYIYVG